MRKQERRVGTNNIFVGRIAVGAVERPVLHPGDHLLREDIVIRRRLPLLVHLQLVEHHQAGHPRR